MKFLLTNDDGIDAPGLEALRQAVEPLGEIVIVAPDRHWSGCGHQATVSTPLELTRLTDHRYALDGSPVDCARVGLSHIAMDAEWVIAGVNDGGNLGADVYLSGTVAAAREGCFLGKPAVAVSQYVARRPIDWERAALWTRHALEELVARPPAPGSFWNVNLPQPDGRGDPPPSCAFCQLDPNPLPVDYELREGKLYYRARYQDRLRTNGYDVELCFSGRITISQVYLFSAAGSCNSPRES